MRFIHSVVPALLVAVSLATSVTAHADINAVRNHLAVAEVCGQGAHVLDIRNSGTSTTSFLYYKITARAAEGMPALKSWTMPLFPLAVGQVFQLSVPQAAWGLKISISLVSAGAVLDSAPAATTVPNFCW